MLKHIAHKSITQHPVAQVKKQRRNGMSFVMKIIFSCSFVKNFQQTSAHFYTDSFIIKSLFA